MSEPLLKFFRDGFIPSSKFTGFAIVRMGELIPTSPVVSFESYYINNDNMEDAFLYLPKTLLC